MTFVPLARGQFVIVEAAGRRVRAMVGLASPNGRAAIVLFDAVIGGWAAQMPIFYDEPGGWTVIDGMPVTITPQDLLDD